MPQKQRQSSSSLLVGLENSDLPPYSACIDGELSGVVRQILEKISTDLSLEFSLHIANPADLKKKMAAASIDIKFPDNPRWAMKGDTRLFSKPVIVFTDCFFHHASRPAPTNNRIICGSVTGYSLPVNRTATSISEYKWYDSNYDACYALQSGEIDILYGNMTALPRVAATIEGLDLVIFDSLPGQDGFYHFSALPQHRSVIEEIDHWIDRNKPQLYAWNGENHINL